MTTYIGKAALTLIRPAFVYVHAGEPVPEGCDPEDVQRLVDEGYLVSADDAEAALVEEDSAPAKSASKADWVAWAVSQGADEAAAEDATKDELIEQYGA